uniref:DUF223 domain-containing protein n=2 Tax=Brassica oleracea TaxID=3712 RepID=A0A0D3ABC1_BRAOL
MLHPTRPTTQHLIKLRLFVSLAMANSFTLLADIKACRCSTTAEVRLLRFWEAPNVKRGSKLMGVDMLLIDEQSTLMEGSVSVNLLSIFIERFSEGSVYTMCEFEETIDDIDYKRKVQVQVQDLGTDVKFRDDEIKEPGFIGKKREVDYVNTYPEGPINMEVVTIVLMVLYTWRESSSIQGISDGISDGDNNTDVELPDGVSGEVRESTNANHQPSSSVVPGGGRLASTKPVDGLNENGEKAPLVTTLAPLSSDSLQQLNIDFNFDFYGFSDERRRDFRSSPLKIHTPQKGPPSESQSIP